MSTLLLIFRLVSSDVGEYGPLRWDAQASERFRSGPVRVRKPHSDKKTSRALGRNRDKFGFANRDVLRDDLTV